MPTPSFPRPQGWGVLASAWNREQGEPARLPWEQVQAMLAGGASAEVGCWWWNVPDLEGPCNSAAWLVRILGLWPHWPSSLSRPGLWGGRRAVDGEENQDSETGGRPKIPGSSLRSRTPWGILSIFSLASSTCCFISGPAQRLLTWLLLAPGLQLSLSVSSFRAALSPS